jgi:hypothetical protein
MYDVFIDPDPIGGITLASTSSTDRLADAQQITFILRLVLNSGGYLLHGQMINLRNNSKSQFKDWSELIQLLQKAIPDLSQKNVSDQH